MAKKKLSEKIGDAIDHVLHPDSPSVDDSAGDVSNEVAAPVSEDEKVQSVPLHEQHLALHSKFDKFKATGEKPE